jgi:phosphoribosyl 1,2-cyclic phosphodiesterase
MAARLTVLASGSAGNACLIQADGYGVLIDFGLGPRTLAGRLAAYGLSWRHVHAALLTHTHADHWHENTLAHCVRLGIPLHCHPAHADELVRRSASFRLLHTAGLVRAYESGRALALGPGLQTLPLPIRHDAGATFGFRFEGGRSLFGPTWSIGFAADLGCWDDGLAAALADVDLLALEFNHDEHLQRTSGRPPVLIARVLGDHGHLSNRQAGDLLRTVLRGSHPTTVRNVVTLHLSRECNRPALALASARAALAAADRSAGVHVAAQDTPGPALVLGGEAANGRRPRRRLSPPARGDACA